jgi:hypothetical protein
MKAMKPNTSQSSRAARIFMIGAIMALGAGLVVLAQHVQPQAEYRHAAA